MVGSELCEIQAQLGADASAHAQLSDSYPMDPANPESFNHCRAHLSTRRTYHFVDQKPAVYNEQTVTLLCVHGFPDLW